MGIFKVFFKKFAKFLIYVFKSLILILLTAARTVITNVMEMLAISETSAPSVIFASENATSPVMNGGGFKIAGGHTFCRMSAVDI